jgi:Ca2+-dependent lipid-binding protein
MVAVEAPVLMKNIAFSATVTIEMKTMPGYPFIKLLSISFPELPNVQFSLKPLKGNN